MEVFKVWLPQIKCTNQTYFHNNFSIGTDGTVLLKHIQECSDKICVCNRITETDTYGWSTLSLGHNFLYLAIKSFILNFCLWDSIFPSITISQNILQLLALAESLKDINTENDNTMQSYCKENCLNHPNPPSSFTRIGVHTTRPSLPYKNGQNLNRRTIVTNCWVRLFYASRRLKANNMW